MSVPTKSTFCGFEITLQRNPEADGVIARAVHPNGTIFICNHSENLREANYKIRQVIRTSEFHPQHSLKRAWPTPLLKLYKQALPFLDNQSAVHDRYWASGIVRALDKCFPVLPEDGNGNQALRRARKRRADKQGSKQLPLKLVSAGPTQSGETSNRSGRSGFSKFYRLERKTAVVVGQRVVLISEYWSTKNRMAIQAGTRGQVVKIGGAIKVCWKLPYYRKRFSDRFAPDEYRDYFEEGWPDEN